MKQPIIAAPLMQFDFDRLATVYRATRWRWRRGIPDCAQIIVAALNLLLSSAGDGGHATDSGGLRAWMENGVPMLAFVGSSPEARYRDAWKTASPSSQRYDSNIKAIASQYAEVFPEQLLETIKAA